MWEIMKLDQDSLIQIVSLVILVVLTLFIDPREINTTGKIIFIALVFAFILLIIVWDLYGRIAKNSRNISILKEKLIINKELENMKERTSKLEEWKDMFKNKKGGIDPRIILIIVVLTLIILYFLNTSSSVQGRLVFNTNLLYQISCLL